LSNVPPTDGLNPLAFPLTEHQQHDMFAAAVFTHVNRARRYDQRYLAGEDDVARLTLSWRDVHDNKLVPLDVVVRLASVQMVGREGEPRGA
jgi:hypothetical protein